MKQQEPPHVETPISEELKLYLISKNFNFMICKLSANLFIGKFAINLFTKLFSSEILGNRKFKYNNFRSKGQY